jgi:hypothetical protein
MVCTLVGPLALSNIATSDFFTKAVRGRLAFKESSWKVALGLAIAAPLLMITMKSRKVLRGEAVVWLSKKGGVRFNVPEADIEAIVKAMRGY